MECWTDTEEGRLLESEERCQSCLHFFSEFAYGYNRERYGFVFVEWGWSEREHTERRIDDERKTAREEMHRVYAHPEWPSMRRAPLWVVADWLGDHEWHAQEAALREQLVVEASWQYEA